MTILPAREQQFWTEYIDAEQRGDREGALRTLAVFLDSFEALTGDVRKGWAYGMSRRAVDLEDPFPIRMPLFERGLFPALVSGLKQDDPACARWLSGYLNLICQRAGLREQLRPYVDTPHGLLRHALDLAPEDPYTRRHLIRELTRQLRFSLHAIPSGVLYDHGQGATAEQCRELLEDAELLKGLLSGVGEEAEYQKLIAKCEFHFTEYQKFLEHREKYRDYPQYLAEVWKWSQEEG